MRRRDDEHAAARLRPRGVGDRRDDARRPRVVDRGQTARTSRPPGTSGAGLGDLDRLVGLRPGGDDDQRRGGRAAEGDAELGADEQEAGEAGTTSRPSSQVRPPVIGCIELDAADAGGGDARFELLEPERLGRARARRRPRSRPSSARCAAQARKAPVKV